MAYMQVWLEAPTAMYRVSQKKLLIEIKRSDIGDLDTVSAGGVYIVERIPFPNFYLPLPPPLFRCEII